MRTAKQSQHTPAGRNKPSRPEDKQQGYKAATCRYCGETHPPRRCPAYGKTCARCHRRNHLAKVCQKPQWRTDQPRKVNTLQEGTDSEEEEDALFLAPLFIGNLEEGSQWQEDIDVGQTSIRFKLDTGANANVIPYQTYLRVQKADGNKGTVAPISSTRSILTGIGNGKIRLSFTARWWEEKGSPGNRCHSMSRMKSWSS